MSLIGKLQSALVFRRAEEPVLVRLGVVVEAARASVLAFVVFQELQRTSPGETCRRAHVNFFVIKPLIRIRRH